MERRSLKMTEVRAISCRARGGRRVRVTRHVPGRPAVRAGWLLRDAREGQTLVEFSLVLLVFLVMTVGLIDGLRVIFYYSQVQEAARQGARWASVEVARSIPGHASALPWGDFTVPGNSPGIYCNHPGAGLCPSSGTTSLSSSLVVSTGAVTPTIVGAVTQAANAVDLNSAVIAITTTVSPLSTVESTPSSPGLTNVPVGVTVQYPFRPVLGLVFGGATINLQGTSTMLHE